MGTVTYQIKMEIKMDGNIEVLENTYELNYKYQRENV